MMYLGHVERNRSPMFEELWSEIADMPGEIFDISDDDKEEMAKVFAMSEEEYYEYWNPEQFAH
jgi:hypothetical protein